VVDSAAFAMMARVHRERPLLFILASLAPCATIQVQERCRYGVPRFMAFAGRELFEPRKDLMQRALQVYSLAHVRGLTVGLQLRLLAKEVWSGETQCSTTTHTRT
jgi:hypothetical protein